MTNRSRGLRERVVRGLARVGLVWALAVLATLFMVSAAQGQSADAYLVASSSADAAVQALDVPRQSGLALALVVLAAGMVVLGAGSARGSREDVTVRRTETAPEPDLPLALALGVATLP